MQVQQLVRLRDQKRGPDEVLLSANGPEKQRQNLMLFHQSTSCGWCEHHWAGRTRRLIEQLFCESCFIQLCKEYYDQDFA
jgi:hypothetical protein